jgi:hypothetical protein
MHRDNSTWGEERMANELRLKLGLRVSPRAVRKYLESDTPRGSSSGQRGSTFVRNHAEAVVTCDALEGTRAASCTATSLNIPLPSGRSSNSARSWLSTTLSAF